MSGAISDRVDPSTYFDTIIIGAGLSGINAAYRIQSELPSTSYAILEGRSSLGGTWDLFQYPGIRSDSDMFTFGLTWSPWDRKETLATGTQIKEYLTRSAKSEGIDRNIRYNHSVESANWVSDQSLWELRVRAAGQEEPAIYHARFVLLGTGYYDYETPLQTVIPGIDNFAGKVIHPQFWPKEYDYTGKEIVIVGSGATAVTLLPSLTDRAKRVTMLQRSPSYIMPLAQTSFLAGLLFAILPDRLARQASRLIWLAWSYFTTSFCKAFPDLAKKAIRKRTLEQLPPNINLDPHFNPRYNPWEQRFCACKDGDFFAALRSGKADIVTDKIKKVTSSSIELESGASLQPDVIVTATGLKLKFGGGIAFMVDGEPLDVTSKFAWKSAMLQDVPNMVFLTGYENASWTLGADVSAKLFTRLVGLMKQRNARAIVPRHDGYMEPTSMFRLSSTYVKNALDILPKGGTGQWKPKSHYFADMASVKWGDVTSNLVFL